MVQFQPKGNIEPRTYTDGMLNGGVFSTTRYGLNGHINFYIDPKSTDNNSSFLYDDLEIPILLRI